MHPNSDIIHKVLTETKLIDYDQQICFASVHGSFASNVFTALETLKYLRNVETELVLSNNYYFKPIEECIKTKIWYYLHLLYYINMIFIKLQFLTIAISYNIRRISFSFMF